jgi:hypothetical protein
VQLDSTPVDSPLPALPPHLGALTSRRFHIFPLHHPMSYDECSCGDSKCESDIGKHPRITDWEKSARSHPNGVRAWVRKFPSCNWGVASGPSNLVVIDEDSPRGLEKLCANYGHPFPDTYTVRTRKGFHYYFSHDHNVSRIGNSGALRGSEYAIDVRGAGGYVVAPGSVHRTGVLYEGGDIANPIPLPDFLCDIFSVAVEPTEEPQNASCGPFVEQITPYGRAALDGEVRKILDPATHDVTNNTLNTAGLKISRLIAGQQIPMEMGREELANAARSVGHAEARIQKTLHSAFSKGLTQPRYRNESDMHDLSRGRARGGVAPVDLLRVGGPTEAHVDRSHLARAQADHSPPERATVNTETFDEQKERRKREIQVERHARKELDEADEGGLLTFTPIGQVKRPKREWLIKGFWLSGSYGEIAGGEKSFKSYITKAEVVAIASGRPMLNVWEVGTQGPVTVMIGEGGAAQWMWDAQQIALAMGISEEEFARLPIRLTEQHARIESARFQNSVAKELDEHKPVLLVIDPLYTYYGDGSGAGNVFDAGRILNTVSNLCRPRGVALQIVNHTKKGANKETRIGSNHSSRPQGMVRLLGDYGQANRGPRRWCL